MKIIILGDGEHSKVIQKMIFFKKSYEVIAVLDDKYQQGFQLNGMIHAPISFLWRLLHDDTKVVVAIGNNEVRKNIVKQLDLPPEYYISIIHPSAAVSTASRIGCGTVIMPSTVVNANVDVGLHCIINTGAIVGHGSEISDYTHVSPNAKLTNNASVGEGVYIGSSTTIIRGKHIGSWSVVGPGSNIMEHIPAFSKAVGSPTRISERILIR